MKAGRTQIASDQLVRAKIYLVWVKCTREPWHCFPLALAQCAHLHSWSFDLASWFALHFHCWDPGHKLLSTICLYPFTFPEVSTLPSNMNKYLLLSAPMWGIWHVLPYLNLITALQDNYYVPNFMWETQGSQRLIKLPKLTELVRDWQELEPNSF